jgi:hypothetical protein
VCPCLRRSSRQFRSLEMAPVPAPAPGRGSKPLETAHRAPASVAPRVAPVRFRSLPAVCTRRRRRGPSRARLRSLFQSVGVEEPGSCTRSEDSSRRIDAFWDG